MLPNEQEEAAAYLREACRHLGTFQQGLIDYARSLDPRDASQFGKGDIRGVAGPESANNAGAQTSFIPMLTLGIPSNAVMAMMVGGMMIHGIIPGPQVMSDKPGLFWGLIASMWVGNAMLIFDVELLEITAK